MDRKRSLLNVSVAIASRVILLIVALVVRRLLIVHIGNEVNGLESLYTSIIGMLSVAELGVGSAIIFSMYSPIIKDDKRRVASLYMLYRRLYYIIGVVILISGLLLIPFIPSFIGDYESINVNVYLTFSLTLIAVFLSYLYSAKISLIEAYKDNYITTATLTFSKLVSFGLQMIVILYYQSYLLFVVCHIVESVVNWGLTEIVVRNRHRDILSIDVQIGDEVKAEVTRNIKAMFMHKIGSALCDSVDNITISVFIGVVILGKFSNYVFIATVLMSTLALFFSPLTSVVGHLCADGDKEKIKRVFDEFYCLNFVLGLVFFLGYYAVIESVVSVCFGSDLELSHAIVFIVTINQFSKFMRRTQLLFRNASGAFYYDRWKPVAEGLMNLFLSVLFVAVFPNDYKVVGVIVATLITVLLISHIVEPYVVFHNVFDLSPREFYLRNYAYIALFVICVIVMDFISNFTGRDKESCIVNGLLSVVLSMGTLVVLLIIDRGFRRSTIDLFRSIRGR